MEQRWYQSYDEWFSPNITYPDKTMYELYADTVKQFPDYTACAFLGTKITFSELLKQTDRTAAALKTLGIGKGDVVTICLPNTPHAVIAFYALNRLGAVANMVHPLTPSDELARNIESTQSTFLFVLNAFYPKYEQMLPGSSIRHTVVCAIGDYLPLVMKAGFYLTKGRKIKKIRKNEEPGSADRILTWKDFMKRAGDDNAANDKAAKEYTRVLQPDECAVYLHSGGTMGSPKTIMLSSANFNALAVQGPSIVGIPKPAGLSMATILPLFHGFGLCMGMHTMMTNGITAILVPQFSTESLADLLKKEKPNFIAAVPTLLEGIMKNKKVQDMDLSYIKAVFCGGDTLPGELKVRFDRFLKDHHCDAEVREGYGLTETVTVCAVNPIRKNRQNTVGIPLADILMKVVEPGTENEVETGVSGEICVTGPTVMLGYLNDPQATSEAIHIHSDNRRWVHSGDYGFMDTEGFFHFTQRIKRIIKVSGIPVFPSQIEDVIAKVPGVREVSVIGIPHPYKMQVVKAFITPEDPAVSQETLTQQILDECGKELIRHAVPAQIEYMASLPRTKVGKVDTRALEVLSAEPAKI